MHLSQINGVWRKPCRLCKPPLSRRINPTILFDRNNHFFCAAVHASWERCVLRVGLRVVKQAAFTAQEASTFAFIVTPFSSTTSLSPSYPRGPPSVHAISISSSCLPAHPSMLRSCFAFGQIWERRGWTLVTLNIVASFRFLSCAQELQILQARRANCKFTRQRKCRGTRKCTRSHPLASKR